MSDNKKYYYLKLKDDFFDSEEIKVLESMENGYKYSNILLKMYLKSIKREGLLIFNERIPYNPKMIATVTGHNINDVKQALVLFQEMGMIETLSNGAIYMLDIQNFIGKSTTEADRIRAYRNKIKEKKQKLLKGETLSLNEDCTNVQQKNDKCTPEIEIERELDKEKEVDVEKESDSDDSFKKLVQAFEQNGFGTLSDMVRDNLAQLSDEYTSQWVLDAIKIAVERNARNLRYVEGILKSWQANGKDDGIKKNENKNKWKVDAT